MCIYVHMFVNCFLLAVFQITYSLCWCSVNLSRISATADSQLHYCSYLCGVQEFLSCVKTETV